MCWGFECGKGWHRAIADACRELEVLNASVYPKHRVRIQADQIKEKYSTLRFYYSVVVDPNKFVTWLGHKFESLHDFLSDYTRFDYGFKKVVDVEPYDYDETKELTKEEYEQKTAPNAMKCSNVEFKEADGKLFEVVHLHNCGRWRNVPTKNRLLWKICGWCDTARCFLLFSWPKPDNAQTRNLVISLERAASRVIHLLEQECDNHCEWCGHQIGTKWSPTCLKTGWWTQLCDSCAEKSGSDYIKNNELWHGNEKILDKEATMKRFHLSEDKNA